MGLPFPSVPSAPVAQPGGYLTSAFQNFFNNIVQVLKNKNQFGTAANRPAAGSVWPGTIYFETDTGLAFISDGTTWYAYSSTPSPPGGSTTQVQYNNAGAFGGIANGTAGQVLTSNGASVASFQALPGQAVLVKVVTLTNAQMLALPTTQIQVLPAPGAGFRNKILGGSRVSRLTTGYGNIDATYADLHLSNSVGYMVYPILLNDNTTTPVLTQVTTILGAVGNIVDDIQPSIVEPIQSGLYVISTDPANAGSDPANFDNSPIYLGMNNNGSGNLTLGNAANTFKITLYYAVEAL